MARQNSTHINANGTRVSILDTDTEYKVWDHESGQEIGTAATEEDAQNMING
jgi:hypothetical protein